MTEPPFAVTEPDLAALDGADPSAAPEPAVAQVVSAMPRWTAVVSADRHYFDSMIAAWDLDSAPIGFPDHYPERSIELSGTQMRIGRRGAARGLELEIDLSGPQADPGISHLHAVLIAQHDGTWSVLDTGSSNGTQLNGRDIASGEPAALRDGDSVCLGAWTKLTIHSG